MTVNKAQVSRYQDALSVLGLDKKMYEDWDESDKALFGELTLLDEKQHTKSSAGMITKSEPRPQFYIEPMTHKAASNFYCGPRTIDNETPSVFRYQEPSPSSRALARKSLGLSGTAPERHERVYSPKAIARWSVGLS